MNHCLWVIWGLNSLIIKTEKHPDFDRFKLHNFSSGLFRTSSVLLFICPNFKTEVCPDGCGRRDEVWVFPPESETKYLKILLFGDKWQKYTSIIERFLATHLHLYLQRTQPNTHSQGNKAKGSDIILPDLPFYSWELNHLHVPKNVNFKHLSSGVVFQELTHMILFYI